MSVAPRRPCLDALEGPRRVTLRLVHIDSIIDLRHTILRAGMPPEAAQFDGDDHPNTRHLGAFTGHDDAGEVVGCASFMLNTWENAPAWQLRGMATRDDHRGIGLGRAMLDYAWRVLRDTAPHVDHTWCNARTPATPFYKRLGWAIASEEFVIPTAGPHYRMTRAIPDIPAAGSAHVTPT